MTLKQKAFLVGVLNPDTWTTVCLDCSPKDDSNNTVRDHLIIRREPDKSIRQPVTPCAICGSYKYVYDLKSKQIKGNNK